MVRSNYAYGHWKVGVVYAVRVSNCCMLEPAQTG